MYGSCNMIKLGELYSDSYKCLIVAEHFETELNTSFFSPQFLKGEYILILVESTSLKGDNLDV